MSAEGLGQLVLAAALVGGGVLLGAWLAGVATPLLGDARIDGPPRRVLLGLLRGILVLLGALAGLAWLGVDVQAVGWMLVALTLAAGLALRPLVADFAGGLVVRASGDLRLGDTVMVASEQGRVVEHRMLATVLERPDGVRITVPHRAILRRPVHNFSRSGRRRMDLRCPVAATVDRAALEESVRGLLDAEDEVLGDPPAEVQVQVSDDAATVLVRFWVAPDRAEQVRDRLRPLVEAACASAAPDEAATA